MAVTAFQSEVLKRIARSRIDGGETYIAGGLALNHLLGRPRVSSDIDVFNSSYSALERAADHDCAALEAALASGGLEFHEGTIGGAWPRIIA